MIDNMQDLKAQAITRASKGYKATTVENEFLITMLNACLELCKNAKETATIGWLASYTNMLKSEYTKVER